MSIGYAPCSHRVNQSKRLVESSELLLVHTIGENPDISMERFAAGLPRKNSAPPITHGPAIVDREPDRSALRSATSAPTQRLFRGHFSPWGMSRSTCLVM